MLVAFAVLYDCDYCSPLLNMGFDNAHRLIEKYKSYKKVFQHFLETGKRGFNKEYVKSFEMAVATFKFATCMTHNIK